MNQSVRTSTDGNVHCYPNGTPDIADIELLLRELTLPGTDSGRHREATVATLRFLAHQIKAQWRKLTWINAVVHSSRQTT